VQSHEIRQRPVEPVLQRPVRVAPNDPLPGHPLPTSHRHRQFAVGFSCSARKPRPPRLRSSPCDGRYDIGSAEAAAGRLADGRPDRYRVNPLALIPTAHQSAASRRCDRFGPAPPRAAVSPSREERSHDRRRPGDCVATRAMTPTIRPGGSLLRSAVRGAHHPYGDKGVARRGCHRAIPLPRER
jgi:hypothetical protein